jgi:putative DNA primase/helicase
MSEYLNTAAEPRLVAPAIAGNGYAKLTLLDIEAARTAACSAGVVTFQQNMADLLGLEIAEYKKQLARDRSQGSGPKPLPADLQPQAKLAVQHLARFVSELTAQAGTTDEGSNRAVAAFIEQFLKQHPPQGAVSKPAVSVAHATVSAEAAAQPTPVEKTDDSDNGDNSDRNGADDDADNADQDTEDGTEDDAEGDGIDPELAAAKQAEQGRQQADAEAAIANAEMEIARLAQLGGIAYEHERTSVAKALGMRPTALDTLVKEHQAQTAGGICEDREPWPEPVDLATVLSAVEQLIKSHIVCEPSVRTAAALWAAATWHVERAQVAPIAMITAPEKRCGKSQLLTVLGRLSRRPLTASNITPSALFRVIEAEQPTLMIDEADAFFSANEDLRGLINSGHTRQSAFVIRSVGEDFTPKRFATFGFKAIAGIGRLPETVMDRSIVMSLRRRKPDEQVARLRHAGTATFDELAAKLARAADDTLAAVAAHRPETPEALNDRAADNWELLFAIADQAGGAWPKKARTAALQIEGAQVDDSVSVGEELLTDIRDLFESNEKLDRVTVTNLLVQLTMDSEAPWGSWNRGGAMTARQLTKRLRDYNIITRPLRIGSGVDRGYKKEQFAEAWAQYLTPHKAEPEPLEDGDAEAAAAKTAAPANQPNNPTTAPAADRKPSASDIAFGVSTYTNTDEPF